MIRFTALRNPTLNEPAKDNDLLAAGKEFGVELPSALVAVLQASNGWRDENGCTFYSTREIFERNAVLEVGVYAPDFLAIGDDSGGRVALIDKQGLSESVSISDSGDLNPTRFAVVAGSLKQWIEDGCPFDLHSPQELEGHELVDVYLVRMPSTGLKGLSLIRQAFGLTISLSELKSRAAALPCILASDLTVSLFRKRSATLGDVASALECRLAKDRQKP
jgi:hypothetical protein